MNPQRSLAEDVSTVLRVFRACSPDEFAFLPLWFDEVLRRHNIRRDGFDVSFMAHLAYEGWFLFCYHDLVPKFHQQKMLLDVTRWSADTWCEQLTSRSKPVSHGAIKPRPLANRLREISRGEAQFNLTVSDSFRRTVERVNAFQQSTIGQSWISPAMVDAMVEFERQPVALGDSQVRMYAWDLREAGSNELVAADVGYQVGGVYSSMSGFSDRRFPSIGIVQLLAQLELMQQRGIVAWDLGMPMDYKRDLSADTVDGDCWLARLHAARDQQVQVSCGPQPLNELPALMHIGARIKCDSGRQCPLLHKNLHRSSDQKIHGILTSSS